MILQCAAVFSKSLNPQNIKKMFQISLSGYASHLKAVFDIHIRLETLFLPLVIISGEQRWVESHFLTSRLLILRKVLLRICSSYTNHGNIQLRLHLDSAKL